MPIQDDDSLLKKRVASADLLSAALARTGRFRLVSGADVEGAIARLKAESYRACVDEACQITLGKELAADSVLMTRVLRVGSVCRVIGRVFDLREAAAAAAAIIEATCDENTVLQALEVMAKQLGGQGDATLDLALAPKQPPGRAVVVWTELGGRFTTWLLTEGDRDRFLVGASREDTVVVCGAACWAFWFGSTPHEVKHLCGMGVCQDGEVDGALVEVHVPRLIQERISDGNARILWEEDRPTEPEMGYWALAGFAGSIGTTIMVRAAQYTYHGGNGMPLKPTFFLVDPEGRGVFELLETNGALRLETELGGRYSVYAEKPEEEEKLVRCQAGRCSSLKELRLSFDELGQPFLEAGFSREVVLHWWADLEWDNYSRSAMLPVPRALSPLGFPEPLPRGISALIADRGVVRGWSRVPEVETVALVDYFATAAEREHRVQSRNEARSSARKRQ